MKKSLNKKQGFEVIVNMAVAFILLIPVFAIVITFINIGGDTIKATKFDGIANEYIMRMESKGYLYSMDEIDLKQELEKAGLTNIDLSGTTKNNIGFGQSIKLNIKGIYNMKVLDMNGEDKGSKIKSTPINIVRSSVSKN